MKRTKLKVVAKMATRLELTKGLAIKPGTLVEVEWLLPEERQEAEDEEVETPMGAFCSCCTVGKVVSFDERVLCLATSIILGQSTDLVIVPVEDIETVKIIEEIR